MGTVSGDVRFVDSRIHKRLGITPLLVVASGEPTGAAFQPPLAPSEFPEPFARWTLDLKIESPIPFQIPGVIASGEVIPNISLRGTVGQPVPVGRLTLQDVQAFLTGATMSIPEGRVDFLPDSPWIPLLDVRATARTDGVGVQAYAFGPLNEKKLILRSEPPLSQASLVLLLAGESPLGDRSSGPGFVGAAAAQDTLFPEFSIAGKFDWPGVDAGTALNSLDLQAISPRSLGERITAPRKFLLAEPPDLVPEREGNGLQNSAATYTWQFR
jgi:hypothetical protein